MKIELSLRADGNEPDEHGPSGPTRSAWAGPIIDAITRFTKTRVCSQVSRKGRSNMHRAGNDDGVRPDKLCQHQLPLLGLGRPPHTMRRLVPWRCIEGLGRLGALQHDGGNQADAAFPPTASHRIPRDNGTFFRGGSWLRPEIPDNGNRRVPDVRWYHDSWQSLRSRSGGRKRDARGCIKVGEIRIQHRP